jgi:NitT/TauT family transport system substrate-binding protein
MYARIIIFILNFEKLRRANVPGKFILLLALVVLLSACRISPQEDTTRTDTLVLATLKGPSSMGMIRIIDSLRQGDEHRVEVKILNEPMQVRKMMIEQSADFVILPTTMAALLYNKGLEYQVVAIPVWGSLYLFAGDSTITRWEDLRGRRINLMARGMTPDVLFRYLLIKNNIDPDKDVRLDYSFPTHIDLANAVAAGRCELAVISEPMASMVEEKNKSVHRLFSLSEEWEKHQGNPVVETSFMVRKSIIKAYPEAVEQLLSSYESSTNWVNFKPDSAARLLVKYDISPNYQVGLSSIKHAKLKFVRAKGIGPEIVEYLEVFKQMNPDIIGGKIPDENFIY